MVPWWRSIVVRTVAVYILVPAVLTAIGITILHDAQEREVQEKFGVALRAAAASTSPYLDSDDLAAIKTNADADSPAFARTRAVLARARSQNNRVGYNLRFGADDLYRGIHKSMAIDRSEGVGQGQIEILFDFMIANSGGVVSRYYDFIKVLARRTSTRARRCCRWLATTTSSSTPSSKMVPTAASTSTSCSTPPTMPTATDSNCPSPTA